MFVVGTRPWLVFKASVDVHPPSLEINAKRCPQRCRSSGLAAAALCTSFKAALYSSCSAGFCMLHGHDCCWMDLDGIANEYDGSFCVVFLQARKGLKMSQASQDLKCCKPQNTILDFWYREIIRIRNVRVCINR